MNIRKGLMVLAVVIAAGSLGISAWAGGQNLQLMPLEGSPKASGTVELGRNTLKIDVEGLKPDSD